jgi:tripartite-type tricarboxylate transporter receptor subunit TctC
VGYVLGVHPSLPVRSVADLIALARRSPGKLNYGTVGNGSVVHVVMEMLSAAAGIRMNSIQYKGMSQVVTDLGGGHIELAFFTTSNALGMAQQGRMRPIGVSGARRWKQLPDVPTIAEAGIAGFEFYAWFAFWFPVATPVDIVNRMQAEIARAAVAPDVAQRLDESGFEPYVLRPEEFGRLVQDDIAATIRLANRLGLAPR